MAGLGGELKSHLGGQAAGSSKHHRREWRERRMEMEKENGVLGNLIRECCQRF